MNIWQTVFSLFVAVVGFTDGASVEERKLQLGGLEIFLNGLFGSFIPLEIDTGFQDLVVVVSALSFDDGEDPDLSDDFPGEGDLVLDVDPVNDQTVVVTLAALDVLTVVDVGLDIPVAVNVTFPLEITSEDFNSALPSAVSFPSDFDCATELLVNSFGIAFDNVFEDLFEEFVCPFLDETFADLSATLASEQIIQLSLLPISSDIEQAVAAGESAFAAPGGFEFFEQAELDAVFDNLLNELENLPLLALGDDLEETLFELGAALGSGQPQVLADALSELLTQIVGDPIVISAQDVIDFQLFQVIGDLLAVIQGFGDFEQFIGDTLLIFGVPIPTFLQVDNVVQALPEVLLGLTNLIPTEITEDIENFLDQFGSELNTTDVGGFLFEFFGPDVPLDTAIIALFDVVRVQFLLDTFGGSEIPAEVFIVFDFLGIQLEARVIDIIDDIAEIIIGLLETFGIQVFPEIVPIEVSRRLQTIDIGSLINNILPSLIPLQLVSVNLDPLGEINVTLVDSAVNLELGFITDNLGLLGQSSFGLPGLDVSSGFIGAVFLVDIGAVQEAIEVNLNFDVLLQFAPTIALNYDNLQAFGFAQGVDLKAIADVARDLGLCTLGSVAIDFSTFAASLDLSLDTTAGLLAEVSDFLDEAVAVVLPGAINAGLNFAAFAIPLLEFSEFSESCNDLSLTFVGDDGDDDDDDGDDGIFGSLGDEVGFAIVGVGALFILLIVLFALGVGRGKPKSNQAAAGEAKEEAAAKVPMADTVGEKGL